jgi:hypothetical protein
MNKFRYRRLPKIKWRHDAWTLNRIMSRRPQDKSILQALIYLRTLTFSETSKITKITIGKLVGIAKSYNNNGLASLISPEPPSLFDDRIQNFLKLHPEQKKSLFSCKDLELYADWANVTSKALFAWIIYQEFIGEKQI